MPENFFIDESIQALQSQFYHNRFLRNSRVSKTIWKIMKNVALLTIHGMGDTKEDYHEDLVEGLIKRIGLSEWRKHVHFESIYYQDILQANQREIWMRMHQYPLESNRLRQLMLFGFGDAGSLEYSGHNNQIEYKAVQQRIFHGLENSFKAGGESMIPVVVLAQSLGCQVLSNYLWDSQQKNGIFRQGGTGNSNHDRFCRLKSCHQLVTTGCNIPMFVSGLKAIQCFEKPSDEFRWDNYFDSDDFLGWPLGPLDDSYGEAGVEDHHIGAGGLISSQTWASHTKYWTDADVIKPLSRRLEGLIAGAGT